MRIGIRCDAGTQTGFGHLVRELALAEELRRRDADCVFYMTPQSAGKDLVFDAGFYMCLPTAPNWVGNEKFDAFIVDLEHGCPMKLAEDVRPSTDRFVVLDGTGYKDEEEGRRLADIVIFQGATPYAKDLDWDGFEGKWYSGPEWVILRKEFVEACKYDYDREGIVILGGGSDPKGVTELAVDALRSRTGVTVVLGPGFDRELNCPRWWRILRNPDDLVSAMAGAKMAVASYGMTVYELMCLGIPTVVVSISEYHAGCAAMLESESLISLGEIGKVTPAQIEYALEELREPVSRVVDGKGAERVADLILGGVR